MAQFTFPVWRHFSSSPRHCSADVVFSSMKQLRLLPTHPRQNKEGKEFKCVLVFLTRWLSSAIIIQHFIYNMVIHVCFPVMSGGIRSFYIRPTPTLWQKQQLVTQQTYNCFKSNSIFLLITFPWRVTRKREHYLP